MPEESSNPKDDFLNPISKYYGEFTPGNLAFNYNLQEFANQVSYICGLESNGKINSHEAYERIKELWSKLKISKTELLDKNDNPPTSDQ
ncbi:MAG: hypothetical protein QNJ70_01915 [Xenococcaceae cyanobacterium MO_207.B15]|nr:hypothetical protein [Xenococcaceae cyanobacterium MO_207.B15]